MDVDGIIIGGSTATAICGLIGAWLKSRSASEDARRHADAVKPPQPFIQEQSGYQADMKENFKAHENLFSRVAALEKITAGHDASIQAQREMTDRMFSMLAAIYERIIGGPKK